MNHLCWTLLGITELELFNSTESSSDTMAKILYAIFIIVALVLLVNMMIAVLSHTYERVEVIFNSMICIAVLLSKNIQMVCIVNK